MVIPAQDGIKNSEKRGSDDEGYFSQVKNMMIGHLPEKPLTSAVIEVIIWLAESEYGELLNKWHSREKVSFPGQVKRGARGGKQLS